MLKHEFIMQPFDFQFMYSLISGKSKLSIPRVMSIVEFLHSLFVSKEHFFFFKILLKLYVEINKRYSDVDLIRRYASKFMFAQITEYLQLISPQLKEENVKIKSSNLHKML